MNFFNSVFAEDSDPEDSDSSAFESQPNLHEDANPEPDHNPSISTIAKAWSFGGVLKTLASKSESVIEAYKRDIEEFSSGLKKETAAIREAAGRAARDLPASLEAGAAAAQESLESVGEAIDNFGSAVSEIISHGKDSILAVDSDSENYNSKRISDRDNGNSNLSRPYSRLEAQIRSIQCDLSTYSKDPEDVVEFNEWKLGFELGGKEEEIENLIVDNEAIDQIYNNVVPGLVDRETFWIRYFFRIYKIKKSEEARANLVKRAIASEEEEDLSWDVDDEDNDDGNGEKDWSKLVDCSKTEVEDRDLLRKDKGIVSDESGVDDKVLLSGCESSGSRLENKYDEKLGTDGKTGNGGSCKDSDFSVVSSQLSMPEEEDLGWDEIEDTGSTDEMKAAASGSANMEDLRKRLSAMDEEENLAWDIEDDDEPLKS